MLPANERENPVSEELPGKNRICDVTLWGIVALISAIATLLIF